MRSQHSGWFPLTKQCVKGGVTIPSVCVSPGVSPSVGKVELNMALELSLYLSQEMGILPVTQGFGELVPLYKLMEKRDMKTLENQMKVGSKLKPK